MHVLRILGVISVPLVSKGDSAVRRKICHSVYTHSVVCLFRCRWEYSDDTNKIFACNMGFSHIRLGGLVVFAW